MHSEPIVRLFGSALAETIQGTVEACRKVPKAARPGDWLPSEVRRRRTVGTVRYWLHVAGPYLARLRAALPGSPFQTRERCVRKDRSLCGLGRPTGLRRRTDKGYGQLLESGRTAEGPRLRTTGNRPQGGAVDRAMQQAGECPFPRYVDEALVGDAVRAECVSEAPAEQPGVTRVVVEPKQKCSFRIGHLLLETQATERSKRHAGKAGHEYEEAIVEVHVE
jgi:hypothetical protein